MHSMTKTDRRLIMGRMGKRLFDKRLHLEDNRELKMGGRVRICPMRLLRPVMKFAFKASGLWSRGFREFMNPVVRENRFVIPGLPQALDGFTILHLSDLHLDLDTRLTPVLFQKIQNLKYDIAVITGDFNNFTVHVDGTALEEMEKLVAAFSSPIYGVLGNHDSLRDVVMLERMGTRILLNECVRIRHNGLSMRLAGIDDPNIFQTHDVKNALSGVHDAALTILLSHSPCIHREAAAENIDLVLAGHTHGGQICLPGGKSIRLHNDRGAVYVHKGFWREGATQGWTSSGTGSCGIPVRLNCPPEIMLHRLTAI